MSGGGGEIFRFNSGRFSYSNRTPPKIPNDPGKVISWWLWRMQLFLGSEGLEHTITTTNPTGPVYVISCKDRGVLVSIHGEKLVVEPKKRGDTCWRRPATQKSKKNWSLAIVFPRYGRSYRGDFCLLLIVMLRRRCWWGS